MTLFYYPLLPGPDLVFKGSNLFRGRRARAGQYSITPCIRQKTDPAIKPVSLPSCTHSETFKLYEQRSPQNLHSHCHQP